MASIAKLAKLARSHLAPSGVMRAGINLSNVLLVTGADARGAPIGVAPDMAAELARRLGVPVQLEPFAHPDVLCEAATAKRWDIALVGADPARAEHIAFSPAYCEIQCTYLVRANDRSRFASPADVDVPGARIAVKGGGAYDLWLARHLRHAEIVRAATLDASFELFDEHGLDALAGLGLSFSTTARKATTSSWTSHSCACSRRLAASAWARATRPQLRSRTCASSPRTRSLAALWKPSSRSTG